VLDGNEVAVPAAWQAAVVVRRTNIFDDAHAMFDFSVDPLTGAPAFGQPLVCSKGALAWQFVPLCGWFSR
jgi:hypothetical protein